MTSPDVRRSTPYAPRGNEIPPRIAVAMERLFEKRRIPGSPREWMLLLLGGDADLIQGRYGKRLYNLAGYAHENARREFEIVLAELAAVAITYFVMTDPPKPKRKLMENYVFEPFRDRDTAKWHFDIMDRETGNLLATTAPRKNLDVARMDCRRWFNSASPAAAALAGTN
jgi:hypothetical protein